ncbi:hypothetical protein DK261_13755 [Pseudomonas sp. RW409]|nr:hypothetical protein DK261_13755 [Pseudomonas sp. RW409]
MSFPAKSFIAGFLFIRTKARGMHAVNKIDLCPEQPDQRKAPTTAYGIFSHGPIKFRPVPPLRTVSERPQIPASSRRALHTGTTLQAAEHPVIQADEDSFISRY